MKQVAANQKKMQQWAHHCPENYQHKYELVEAEKARVWEQDVQAMTYYERAITGAKEQGLIQEEALANELAAEFHLSRGREKMAKTYMTDAYYAYARWGAKAKVEDLEKLYPQLLAPILQPNKIHNSPSETISTFGKTFLSSDRTIQTIVSSGTSVSAVLDLATVIKANQALSSEIELDKLLSGLMQVVMENAGADKGALVLVKRDDLFIEAICALHSAAGITNSEETTVLQSIPVEDSQEIPITLINSVKRSQETLIIDDATTQTPFVADPYIIRQQPKSLLCIPILHQGKLIGLLYVENNLTTGAFTSNRVEVLRLLCSQVAISLENAQLYQQSQAYAQQLEKSLQQLQQVQLQVIQSEKMSALGNLVAGVAHEINNPLGFLKGSLNNARDYVQDLLEHLQVFQQHCPHPVPAVEESAQAIDLEFLIEDLPKLIDSMKVATERICNISTSLRTFSRADTDRQVACK